MIALIHFHRSHFPFFCHVCVCTHMSVCMYVGGHVTFITVLHFISLTTICIIHSLLICLLFVSLPLDSKLHQDRDFDYLMEQYLPSA